MNRKLMLNTLTSILFQIVTVICGFILPRLIIKEYGSEVNGLVQSITQFLSIISFLELGVGAVIQSSLYSPLSNNNNTKISEIVVSGSKFFKKIAYILVAYTVVLVVVYPFLTKSTFDWIYIALLIASMSISSFAQYYFGIIDRLLLNADQKGYIQYVSQIATLILNTVACVILIYAGASIQIVKLTTSLIFLMRPLVLRVYVNKHYNINRHIKYSSEPITQKWNGIAQHVATVVLENTDTVVLTLLSTLNNVSIYSVYHMVIYGVKQLFLVTSNSIEAFMGELIAKKKDVELKAFFSTVEFGIHSLVVLVFSCVGILVIPFIKVYLKGALDINEYIQPVFAVLLVCAHAFHCIRLPYNMAIKAGGHFKQTQHNYIVAAIMNIVISIATVWVWGLIGVAIGTLVAMVYQTVWMAAYDSRHIINWPFKSFIKQCIVDLINIIMIVFCCHWLKLDDVSYIGWVIMAVEVFAVSCGIVFFTSLVFYKKQISRVGDIINARRRQAK